MMQWRKQYGGQLLCTDRSEEVIAFDKDKYFVNSKPSGKDCNFYKFEAGEEIETVVVNIVSGGYSGELYMYSGFLDIYSGDGVNAVGDGSYMFRLD